MSNSNGNGTMGKAKLHDRDKYGPETARLLDNLWQSWSLADVAADFHSYESETRNARAEARWERYEHYKAQADELVALRESLATASRQYSYAEVA